MKIFETFDVLDNTNEVNHLESIPFEMILPIDMGNILDGNNENLGSNFINVGVGYRIVNSGIGVSNWHDQIMIIATLVDDLSGELISECKVTAFDLTTTAPHTTFNQTKISQFGPIFMTQSSYTLTIKSKFAAWGFAGKYIIFAGGAEVYVDGQLFKQVRFEPTPSRAYSENEIEIIKITKS